MSSASFMDPKDPFSFSTTSSESSKHKRSRSSVSNLARSSGRRKPEKDPDYIKNSSSSKNKHRRNKTSKGIYHLCLSKGIGTTLQPPPLFGLKLVYSYVIKVADSESDLGLHGKPLVSEIFAFYHLLEYARGRPGRRGHILVTIFYSNFFFKIF